MVFSGITMFSRCHKSTTVHLQFIRVLSGQAVPCILSRFPALWLFAKRVKALLIVELRDASSNPAQDTFISWWTHWMNLDLPTLVRFVPIGQPSASHKDRSSKQKKKIKRKCIFLFRSGLPCLVTFEVSSYLF